MQDRLFMRIVVSIMIKDSFGSMPFALYFSYFENYRQASEVSPFIPDVPHICDFMKESEDETKTIRDHDVQWSPHE